MVANGTNTEGMLIWAAPGPSASRQLVETAARELRLAVRFCTYKELLDLLHTERCHVACIEFGFDAHPGLTLLKNVSERMPRLTSVVASNDASVSMIRTVLEAGAADFLSLPLNPQELNKALIKLSQTALKGPSARGQAVGNIITVCGARGGLGATTLAVELTLQLLRTQFPHTVVDTPRTLTGAMLAALEQSDHILILTDLSVPGVRAARRMIELLLRLNVSAPLIEPVFSHVIPGPVTPQ